MKTKPSSRHVASREYRQRIDAITGKVKVTPRMLRGSLGPLLTSLEKHRTLREQSHAAHLRDLERLAKAHGPIQKPSPAEMSVFKAIRKAHLHARRRNVAPPVIPYASPQVRSGSIFTFDAPPYWYQWTDGIGTSVNKLDGTWSTGCGAAGTYAHSYAGIATFVKALPGRYFIRFAPYMPINWSYDLRTTTVFFGSPASAWAKGFLGAYVAAYSNGQWVKLRDDRVSIFDRRVTVNTDESDSGDGNSYSPQSTFLTYDQPLYYALWAWGGIETYGSSSSISFGSTFATLACSIPWMVIEQQV
jgi:hypothetical protein